MKITSVEPFLCQGSFITPVVLVKITTDERIVGWGEGSRFGGNVSTEQISFLDRWLIGEDPLNISKIYHRLYAISRHMGFSMNSLAAVETALWDIMGKVTDKPVCALLGGKVLEKIRLYVHCDNIITIGKKEQGQITPAEDLETIAERAKQIKALGYTALKIFGIGNLRNALKPTSTIHSVPWPRQIHGGQITEKTVRNMVKKVEIIRNMMGDEFDICFDAHGIYNIASTVRLARALEPFDLIWYEEPLSEENVKALLTVRNAVKVPLGTGERLQTAFDFRQLLETDAVDVVTPDFSWVGGANQLRFVGNMAQNYYVSLAPHNVAGPLSTLITSHVCATLPNFIMLEFLDPDTPFRDRIISKPLKIKEGYLEIPEDPGWGVDIVESEVKKHMYFRGHSKSFPEY